MPDVFVRTRCSTASSPPGTRSRSEALTTTGIWATGVPSKKRAVTAVLTRVPAITARGVAASASWKDGLRRSPTSNETTSMGSPSATDSSRYRPYGRSRSGMEPTKAPVNARPARTEVIGWPVLGPSVSRQRRSSTRFGSCPLRLRR